MSAFRDVLAEHMADHPGPISRWDLAEAEWVLDMPEMQAIRKALRRMAEDIKYEQDSQDRPLSYWLGTYGLPEHVNDWVVIEPKS
jgi:hypothetical protein